VRWRGTSNLKTRAVATDGNIIDGIGEINTKTKIMHLAFYFTSRTGMRVVQHTGDSTDLPAGWASGDGPLSSGNPLPAMYMQLGNDYQIIADDREMPVTPSPLLFWPQVDPNFKPETIASRVTPSRWYAQLFDPLKTNGYSGKWTPPSTLTTRLAHDDWQPGEPKPYATIGQRRVTFPNPWGIGIREQNRGDNRCGSSSGACDRAAVGRYRNWSRN
jgi:hypothetical protein